MAEQRVRRIAANQIDGQRQLHAGLVPSLPVKEELRMLWNLFTGRHCLKLAEAFVLEWPGWAQLKVEGGANDLHWLSGFSHFMH